LLTFQLSYSKIVLLIKLAVYAQIFKNQQNSEERMTPTPTELMEILTLFTAYHGLITNPEVVGAEYDWVLRENKETREHFREWGADLKARGFQGLNRFQDRPNRPYMMLIDPHDQRCPIQQLPYSWSMYIGPDYCLGSRGLTPNATEGWTLEAMAGFVENQAVEALNSLNKPHTLASKPGTPFLLYQLSPGYDGLVRLLEETWKV
jgi:hypothetical protein